MADVGGPTKEDVRMSATCPKCGSSATPVVIEDTETPA